MDPTLGTSSAEGTNATVKPVIVERQRTTALTPEVANLVLVGAILMRLQKANLLQTSPDH